MQHRKSRFGALETLSETSDENGEDEMVTEACSERTALGPAGFAANLPAGMPKPSTRQMQLRSLLPASIPQLAGTDERNGKVSRSVQEGQDSSSDSEKPAPRTRRSRPVLKDGKPVLIPPLQHEAQQEKIPDQRLPAAPQTASPNASVQVINSDVNESGAPPQVPALLSAQLMSASPGMMTVTIHNEDSDSDEDDQPPPILSKPSPVTACTTGTATANVQVVTDVLKLPEIVRAVMVPNSECVSTNPTTARIPAKAYEKTDVRSAPELISMPLHSLAPTLIEQAMLVVETSGPQLSKPGDYVLFVYADKVQVGTLVNPLTDPGEWIIHVANPSTPGKHGAKTVKRTLMFSPVSETWRDFDGAIWLGDKTIDCWATRRAGQKFDVECKEKNLGHLMMQASTKDVNSWKRPRHPNGSASSNSDLSDSAKAETRQNFQKQRSPSGKPAPKSSRQ